MSVLIGLLIAVGSLIGGFAAMGGHVAVLWQPWELVIILGTAIGTYFVANPMKTVTDTGTAVMEALRNTAPSQAHYFEVLGVLYALMRELRNKGRAEIEQHIETPYESALFAAYPGVLADTQLTTFICDYFRLIIVGKAQAHEVEALLDEEIGSLFQDRLKPYYALGTVSEALPALGIVAAVLGVIKARGAIDQSPALLGGFIGAALAQARELAQLHRVPVVVECILEKVTNIAMGTEIDKINEFEAIDCRHPQGRQGLELAGLLD